MRIEIWSDVVCPWCYIGKRRWESAITAVDFGEDVEVVWRSFQLDPGAAAEPGPVAAEHLGRKYGGGEPAGRAMVDKVEAVAAEEGMVWRHHQSRPVNTLDAHRLLHLALDEAGPELQGQLKEALLAAYFVRAENVASHEVLGRAAVEAGLPADRVEAVLAGDEFRDAVLADQQQAYEYGASGVPFAVLAGRYGVSGAQPVDTLTDVLEQARAATRPRLEMTGAAGADACGPDGCAT